MITLSKVKLICSVIQNNDYFKISLVEDEKTISTLDYKFVDDYSELKDLIVKDVTLQINIYNEKFINRYHRYNVIDEKCLFLMKTKNIYYGDARKEVMDKIKLETPFPGIIPETFEASVMLLLHGLKEIKISKQKLIDEKESWLNSDIYKKYLDMKSAQHQQITDFRSSKF